MQSLRFALLFTAAAMAQSQRSQTSWGQCGGSGYSGPTACPAEFYCTVGNPYYSQCVSQPDLDDPLPGVGVPDSPIDTTSRQTVITVTNTAPRPSEPAETIVTTIITYLTPRPQPTPSFTAPPGATAPDSGASPGSTVVTFDDPLTFRPINPRDVPRWITAPARRAADPSPAPEPEPKALAEPLPPMAAAGPEAVPRPAQAASLERRKPGDPTPSQLKQGQYWIRAVTPPHFHEYLQTNPQNGPSMAIMGDHTKAGQYNVVDGQLVSGGTDDALYMHVEKPDDFTQRKLSTWFNYTQNEFGTFAFSGDALTWSTPEVNRQNLAAWLVCADNQLFINTGAYAYQTPEGCSDHTIHYYNGATADM